MFRSTRLIAVAAAAAAFVPVAHAAAPSQTQEPAADVAPCGWVTVTDDLGIPWLTQIPETCPPPAVQPDAQKSKVSAADAAGMIVSPYDGWIVVTDDLGVQWLVPVAHATPSTVGSPTNRVVAAGKKKAGNGKPSAAKQRGFWGMRGKSHHRVIATAPFITDNSPSQNRVAPRKVAATRHLASTLWTHTG